MIPGIIAGISASIGFPETSPQVLLLVGIAFELMLIAHWFGMTPDMSTRFEIDPVLGSAWNETMARREYLLSPLLKYLRRGVVRLSIDQDGEGDLPRFRCAFTGEDIDGESYEFASSNTDGVMAIDDTVARLRRTLTRRHQNKAVQQIAAWE